MQSKYYLIIRKSFIYKLETIKLYDEEKSILYYGLKKIGDRYETISNKQYIETFRTSPFGSSARYDIFQISKKTFQECLSLDFQDLVGFKTEDFFNLIGLNEYAI